MFLTLQYLQYTRIMMLEYSMEGQHHVILMIKGLTVSLEENNCFYQGQLLFGYALFSSDDLGFQI